MQSFADYSDAIFRFCMVKVSNVELAEDFTQEVFTRYWQALRDGKIMTNTRAYLYTIANNMAKDWYKKKKSDSLDARTDAGYEPRDPNADPQSDSEYRSMLRAMDGLEDSDKHVLLLRFVEGLDPKDIAEILGESANTISVRIHRALERLRDQLHI